MPLDETESRIEARKRSMAKGIEPEISWNGEKGFLDTPALEGEPDPAIWETIIEDWGLDPKLTEIVDGSVHIRGWDTNVGDGEVKRMRYYRAAIRRKQVVGDRADIDALCKQAMSLKPVKVLRSKTKTSNRAFAVFFADWQLGKSEGGGTAATITRIQLAQDKAIERIKELISAGRSPAYIYCFGMGDLVENCSNHYAMQTFSIDLDRREQNRVARRLILRWVDLCVENFPHIPLVCVATPGNHGENRQNGKAFTSWTDNDDLAAFEGVAEITAANPQRYKNVSFPQAVGLVKEDLSVTLNVCGKVVTIAHGHQFGKGSSGIAKIENWILKQIRGFTTAQDTEILVSAHFHHYLASEGSGRQIFQCPAMDGGSKWFTDMSGAGAEAGMLTMGIGTDYGSRGWGDLLIL